MKVSWGSSSGLTFQFLFQTKNGCFSICLNRVSVSECLFVSSGIIVFCMMFPYSGVIVSGFLVVL